MTERRQSAQTDDSTHSPSAVSDSDRRRFLDLCGKFAVGMPPAITLLLSPFPGQAGHDEGGGVGHTSCEITPEGCPQG